MKIMRRKTKIIKIGNVRIGGNNPIAVQSMAKTKTADVEATVRQIRTLEQAGCSIVRLAIEDVGEARALKKIKAKVKLPLVADIHFNYRLALEAIECGADKIRLNPGNIYKKDEVFQVVRALKSAKIPLRIGVNSGSVREIDSGRSSMADKLVAGAIGYVKMVEGFGFHDIVISLKASDVWQTIEAYRKIAELCAYPLHLGVTATGHTSQGLVKSSIAIGALLMEGIGDTIRVSLTDRPEEEVKAAKYILEALDLGKFGPEIISCPTCGRCKVDLIRLVEGLEDKLKSRYAIRDTQYAIRNTRPAKIAIMGCVVNGPGEAREADIGIAFGKKEGLLFKKGRPIKKVVPGKAVDSLLKEICSINGSKLKAQRADL